MKVWRRFPPAWPPKKLSVIGMMGHTHGVAFSSSPAPNSSARAKSGFMRSSRSAIVFPVVWPESGVVAPAMGEPAAGPSDMGLKISV